MTDAYLVPVRGHTASAVIDGDDLRIEIRCHEPPEADCRVIPTCDCEYYSIERLPDGSAGHSYIRDDVHEFRPRDENSNECKECDEAPDHEWHTADEEIWHPFAPGSGTCNYIDFMDDRPETYHAGGRVVLGSDTPIVWEWDDDHYLWSVK